MRPPSVVSAWKTGASLPTGSSPSAILAPTVQVGPRGPRWHPRAPAARHPPYPGRPCPPAPPAAASFPRPPRPMSTHDSLMDDTATASPPLLLAEWSQFVDDCEQGYEYNVMEYHADLSVRDRI